MHTVHIDDVSGALWACAEWMAREGRKEADTLAGEEIIFHNDKSKVKEVEGMVAHDKKVIAPLFNLVSRNRTMSSYSHFNRQFYLRRMIPTALYSVLAKPSHLSSERRLNSTT
jgi:hypothetical protein